MLTDSHCHIDFRTGEDEQLEVVRRARESGVSRMITVGSGSAGDGGVAAVDQARRVAERFDDVWFTAGVHPHDAALWDERTEPALREALAHPRCVALGECGLDFWYDHSDAPAQEAALRRQVGLAVELGKPIVIHARNSRGGDRAPEAIPRVYEILEAEGAKAVGGQMHCFAGDPSEAERALALGFMISIPGIVTFKKAGHLPDVVRMVPDGALLIETDAPYLAPVPRRGRPNEPAYLLHTARKVAELRGIALEDLAALTSRNAARLFGLPF